LFIVGCGRTDAGVHSSNYVAHLTVSNPLEKDFLFIINKVLPEDILIKQILLVPDSAQAQFHVINRRYDYYIHTKADPILKDISALYESQILDLKLMKEAAKLLIGEHDFIGFCKQPDKHDSTIVNIKECEIYNYNNRIQIRIVANRFLRSMIRLIVGNLLMIGNGNLSLEKWKDVLLTNSNFENFNQAFPQGLYLSGVYYKDLEFDEESFLSLAT